MTFEQPYSYAQFTHTHTHLMCRLFFLKERHNAFLINPHVMVAPGLHFENHRLTGPKRRHHEGKGSRCTHCVSGFWVTGITCLVGTTWVGGDAIPAHGVRVSVFHGREGTGSRSVCGIWSVRQVLFPPWWSGESAGCVLSCHSGSGEKAASSNEGDREMGGPKEDGPAMET